MRYRVHGANRKTGVETSMTVEAATEQAAEATALQTLIVFKIAEEPDRLDEAIAEEAEHPAPQTQRVDPLAGLPTVPHYDGIRIGATVLSVLAALGCAGTVIELLVWFAHPGDLAYLWMSASGLAYAAILWMLASIGLAVRDIAQNSFRKK